METGSLHGRASCLQLWPAYVQSTTSNSSHVMPPINDYRSKMVEQTVSSWKRVTRVLQALLTMRGSIKGCLCQEHLLDRSGLVQQTNLSKGSMTTLKSFPPTMKTMQYYTNAWAGLLCTTKTLLQFWSETQNSQTSKVELKIRSEKSLTSSLAIKELQYQQRRQKKMNQKLLKLKLKKMQRQF